MLVAKPATAAAASERSREGCCPSTRSPTAPPSVLVTSTRRRRRLALAALVALFAARLVVLLVFLLALALALGRLRVVLEILGLAHLDVGLEAGEVGLDRSLHEAQARGDLLNHPLRDEVHVDHDARELVVQLVEGDDACVGHAARRLPGDALVALALGDLALPAARAEPDLLVPGDLVVLLLHVQDTVHEVRELLELRPALVHRPDRSGDVRVALDRQPARLLRAAAASASSADRLRGELAECAAAEALLRALGALLAELLGLALELVL